MKMNRSANYVVWSLVLLVFGGMVMSCSSDDEVAFVADCSTIEPSFEATVNPIIQNKCAVTGCHGTGSVNGPGPLVTYEQIFANRAAIRASVVSGRMPKTGSLTTNEKNQLICWIDNNALDN
jgi:hypothetical protein